MSFLLSALCYGQEGIDKKDLTFSLTGGAGHTRLEMDSLLEGTAEHIGSAFAFSFTYSISNRFALGMRYDRTDTGKEPRAYDRARVTSYSVIAAYRPFINDENYVEARAGFGTGIAAFKQPQKDFYSRANGGLLHAGVSWVRFLTDGFGLKLDLSGNLQNAQEVNTPDGEQEWFGTPDQPAVSSSVRLATLGLLVRY